MQWLVLSVITVVIVTIGAIMVYRQFSRSKQSKKTLFKKTYSTSSSHEVNMDIDSDQVDTEVPSTSEMSEHSVSVRIQSGSSATESVVKETPIDASAGSTSPSAQTVQAIAQSTAVGIEPSRSLTATAEMADTKMEKETEVEQTLSESTEEEPELSQGDSTIPTNDGQAKQLVMATEPKKVQSASDVTELNPESMQTESTVKSTRQFITEIESEPSQTSAVTEEIEKKTTEDKVNIEKVKSKEGQGKTDTVKDKRETRTDKPENKEKAINNISSSIEDIASNLEAASTSPDNNVNNLPAPHKHTEKTKASVTKSTGKKGVELTSSKGIKKEANGKTSTKAQVAATQADQDIRVAKLLKSGKMEDWISIVKTPLSSQNYQAIMQKIVRTSYPRRKESKMRSIFLSHARSYVDTFKVSDSSDSASEYIYKNLAIVLQEDRKFDEAISVCQKAIDAGLVDGTKTGYAGRIKRLEKQVTKKK